MLSDGLTVDVLGAAGQAHSRPSHPLFAMLSGAAGDSSEPWLMVSLPEFRFVSPCYENLQKKRHALYIIDRVVDTSSLELA